MLFSPTADPRWCAYLLKTSLWEHNGRIKVFGGGLLGDEGDLNIWLDELVEKRQVIRVDLRIPVFSGRWSDMQLKVYNLGLPREGARIFWELKRVAEFAWRTKLGGCARGFAGHGSLAW